MLITGASPEAMYLALFLGYYHVYLKLPPSVDVHGVLELLLQSLAPRPLSEELTLNMVQLSPKEGMGGKE